ncbi:MYPU_1760 family metalloprotease [Mycoplasma sp. Z1473D]
MSKKSKIIGWSLFTAGIVLGIGTIAACAYIAIKDYVENLGSDDKETITIKPVYNAPTWQKEVSSLIPLNDKEMQFFSGLDEESKDKALQNANKLGEISLNQYKNNEGTYVEYVDHYTKIKFRDFAYYIDENDESKNRYLLGPGGLAYLANEFKRKVTFGPEVFDLEAININDFTIIPASANGLYIPSTKNIYINGAFMCETDATLYDRVATIMQTLFHEYMHHWANNYAEIALISQDKISNGSIIDPNSKELLPVNYYQPETSNKSSLLDKAFSSADTQYWNAYFANNFKNLLNYDVSAKSYIKPEILALLRERWVGAYKATNTSDALYSNFSPKDLWELSNGINNGTLVPSSNRTLLRKLESKPDGFWYSPDEKFTLGAGDLRYYYSLTELVPREYLKYAFESYYNINEPNPGAIAQEKREEFSSGYFGNMKFHYDKTSQSYEIRPSSVAEDYGKVFMNNFDSLHRSGWYINDNFGLIDPNPIKYWDPIKGKWVLKEVRGSSSIMYPTSPFALESYRTNDPIYKSQLEKIQENNSEDFYRVFLKTMGYGSEISQIYYDNSGWKWVGNTYSQVEKNPNNIKKIKFSGYLKDKNHSGIVVLDKNGGLVAKTNIIYLDTFNFFGHSTFDTGARINSQNEEDSKLRQEQLNNRIYANNNYLSYITEDYINPGNKGYIYFWDDLNKNGLVEENEIVKDHQISLPESRWVTTYRSENNQSYYTVRNKNNQTIIEWN